MYPPRAAPVAEPYTGTVGACAGAASTCPSSSVLGVGCAGRGLSRRSRTGRFCRVRTSPAGRSGCSRIVRQQRWLVWGFEGQPVARPWGDSQDSQDGRWYVSDTEDGPDLVRALQAQGAVTSSVVQAHELSDIGRPGERWEGAAPPTLERVLFHLLQEYARHVGHLDVVRELMDGKVGE